MFRLFAVILIKEKHFLSLCKMYLLLSIGTQYQQVTKVNCLYFYSIYISIGTPLLNSFLAKILFRNVHWKKLFQAIQIKQLNIWADIRTTHFKVLMIHDSFCDLLLDLFIKTALCR